jgi:hypothetical protein
VLIAFVVVASVFAFASLSTGLFASEKAEETVEAGLHGAIGALHIRGIKGTAALNTTTSQPIGTGDGSTTTFSMSNSPLIPGSHAVLVDGITQTFGADYDVEYDTGLVTFTTAPASSVSITADYTYYEISNVKITMSSAASGYPVAALVAGPWSSTWTRIALKPILRTTRLPSLAVLTPTTC